MENKENNTEKEITGYLLITMVDTEGYIYQRDHVLTWTKSTEFSIGNTIYYRVQELKKQWKEKRGQDIWIKDVTLLK